MKSVNKVYRLISVNKVCKLRNISILLAYHCTTFLEKPEVDDAIGTFLEEVSHNISFHATIVVSLHFTFLFVLSKYMEYITDHK